MKTIFLLIGLVLTAHGYSQNSREFDLTLPSDSSWISVQKPASQDDSIIHILKNPTEGIVAVLSRTSIPYPYDEGISSPTFIEQLKTEFKSAGFVIRSQKISKFKEKPAIEFTFDAKSNSKDIRTICWVFLHHNSSCCFALSFTNGEINISGSTQSLIDNLNFIE